MNFANEIQVTKTLQM